MPIGCYLPKRVKFANRRLAVLYWFLWISIVAPVVVNFVKTRAFNRKEDITGHMTTNVWVGYPEGNDALRARVAHAMHTSDFCTVPGKYDYWFDPEGAWAYMNYTCLALCPDNYTDHTCIPIPEIGKRTLSESAFIVTSVRDKVIHSAEPQQPHWRSANYWIMSADHIAVNIAYVYELQQGPHSFLFGFEQPWMLNRRSLRRASTPELASETLTTVILDSESRFWRMVPPGLSITITLEELMRMLGQPTLLDDPNTFLPLNQLARDGAVDKAPMRLTGSSFELELECHTKSNPNLQGIELPDSVSVLESEELCTLKPRRLPSGWGPSEERFDDLGNGAYRHRQYQSVTVSVSKKGVDERLDFRTSLLNVVACIVLLGYPSKIVAFLAMNCLGRLSAVYRRVLLQEFDINMHLAGTATRLSATIPIFESMSDAAGDFESAFQKLHRRLRTVLHGFENLNENNVAALARFTMDEMRHIENTRDSDSWASQAMCSAGLKTRMSHNSTSDAVGPELLSSASWCDGLVSARDLAHLFDTNRKVSVLERVFTPAKLWTAVHKARERQQDAEGCGFTSSPQDECDNGSQGAVQQSSRSATQPQTDLPSPIFSSELVAELVERLAQSELRLAESERCMKEWKEAASCTMSSIEARVRELELLKTDKRVEVSESAEGGRQEFRKREYTAEEALRDKLRLLELEHRLASLEQHLSIGVFEELNLAGAQFSAKGPASSSSAQDVVSEDSEALRASSSNRGQVSGRTLPRAQTQRMPYHEAMVAFEADSTSMPLGSWASDSPNRSLNDCPQEDIERHGYGLDVPTEPEPNTCPL